MSATRGFYKMKDYRMKEMAEEFCAKGIGAVETSQRLQEKFGDSAPTICTIYKWRRDFKEGQEGKVQEGKREREERKETEPLDEGQKSAKIPKKVSSDKYCVECNRDLCNRQYFEMHMLKFHDILLGDTKSVIEYLDQLEPSKTQNLIFRCDACFGGALDYDTIEELQQHKLLEHGQQMRMPKWCSKKVKSPSKTPLQNVRSSVAPSASSRITPPTGSSSIPKYTKVVIRRDKSLPASSSLRRSNRVPKPISTLNYLMLAKDFNEMKGGGEKEERKNSNSPTKEFSRRGRPSMNRTVNFKEEIKEIESSTNEGMKLERQIHKEKPASAQPKHQQGRNMNGKMNNGGLSPEKEKDDEEEDEFEIKEDPVELEEEEEEQIQQQKQPQEKQQDNPSATNDKPEPISSPHKRRMLSPDALDAANSLLKLTFGSPLSLTGVFEETNSSPIANESNGGNVDGTILTSTTTKTTNLDTSISNLPPPNSPPPTVSTSSSTSTIVQQQKSPPKMVANESNLLPQSPPNLPKTPSPPPPTLRFQLPQPQNFSGFSNAELTEIEKAERKALETRINALKNIQMLFDEAMIQFQHYLAAMPSTTNTTGIGNGPINGIISRQQESAISNFVPSSSSTDVGTSTSSTSSSSSMMMPTAIQNGISASASSSTTTTTMNNNTNKS